jgi:hypothetical protein
MADNFTSGNGEVLAALGALGVIILGFAAARLAQRGVGRSLGGLDAWLSRYSSSDTAFISPTTVVAIRGVAFWLVILFAVVVALRILGVGEFSFVLEGIVEFIPRLLVAVVVVGMGHLLGVLARGLVARTSDAIEPDALIPRIVHTAILAVAVLIGLQHMDIDISFITQLVLALLVILLGGLTLSFALGARTHVSNLLARTELHRYAIGERIRIDDIEGSIIHIHATGVEISTAAGTVSVPAAKFSSLPVLKLPEEAGREP